jgi:type II pantothenate kinase
MIKVIGIDIGGSITKIIGFDNNTMLSPTLVKAADPLASVYGALGKFLSMNKLSLSDISQVMITGVGASFITENLYGIPTGKVDEFMATSMGGLFLSGLSKAIIVSMGTGTAFALAEGSKVEHIGGTGVGGGTLLGLSNMMLNIRNFDDLIEIAKDGHLSNVDLSINDVTKDVFGTLPHDLTASNFGKVSDLASKADAALGIINLVFETIGMLSVFATQISKTKDIVLTGQLANVPQGERVFNILSKLYGISFHISENAKYATAVGAAITFLKGMEFNEIID